MGGSICNKNGTVEQFKKSEKKCKRELKELKKSKKLHIMAKSSRTNRELEKTKNICSRNPRSTSTLPELDLAVIMIPTYLVTFSELNRTI